MFPLTHVVSPVRKATQHMGNSFFRWIQGTYVRELGLGSLTWKLWPNQTVKSSKVKFFTLNLVLWLPIFGSATGQVLLGGGGWVVGVEGAEKTVSKELQAVPRIELGKRKCCLPLCKNFRQPLPCKSPGAEAWKTEQASPRQRCALTPGTAKSKN